MDSKSISNELTELERHTVLKYELRVLHMYDTETLKVSVSDLKELLKALRRLGGKSGESKSSKERVEKTS